MYDIQLDLEKLLRRAASRLDRAGLARSLVVRVERLVEQVQQPCIVAVIGKIKAGKSTFVNALLEQDLAKVGVEETTATVNYFRYGAPHPDYPVRCYWNDGRVTSESRQFLDSLQGHDRETLRRSANIERLEYYVQRPFLERITLVDTPGMGGLEEHHKRAANFLGLQRLREDHDAVTREIDSEADAVIYLLGAVALIKEKELLEEFQQMTRERERSLNAIGVIARIDLDQDLVQRRAERAAHVAQQLQESLNTVLAVSASLELSLKALDAVQMKQLVGAIRHIPDDSWHVLLGSPRVFRALLDGEASASPLEERQLLLKYAKDMHWGVFVTIVRLASNADLSLEEILKQLHAIAGFDYLREILDRYFVKRGQWLRSYRIVNLLRAVLREVTYEYLPEFHDEEAERKEQRERFLSLLKRLHDPVARSLEAFVEEQLAPREDLGRVVREIEQDLSEVEEILEMHNGDFVALQLVEDEVRPDIFDPDEKEELRRLFGFYGLEISARILAANMNEEYVITRRRYWSRKSSLSRDVILIRVATQAARRYNQIARILRSNFPPSEI